MKNAKGLLAQLGPGILFASTCIGVSHLVQSTRAGADYGLSLIWAIIAANLFKYPFFEFASRYTASTGKSLLVGYKEKGNWVLWIYIGITICSMITVNAAVFFVTAGLLANLFPSFAIPIEYWTLALMLCCAVILFFGSFSTFDTLLKIMASVLVLSTLIALVAAMTSNATDNSYVYQQQIPIMAIPTTFIIALMGWMPTALDLSVWTSLWQVEKYKSAGRRATMKEALVDFNIGYWLSAVLAICFLLLGAFTFYGSGIELASGSKDFTAQISTVFTTSIGSWAYVPVILAMFSTMFSTSITVMDGYGRSFTGALQLALQNKSEHSRWAYLSSILLIGIGTLIIVFLFRSSMKDLVDLATVISFVIAPIAAFINLNLILSKEVDKKDRPGKGLLILAVLGLIYLLAFTFYFLFQF